VKRLSSLAAAGAALLALAAPASAASAAARGDDQVGQRGDVRMLPGMSYIFFRSAERLDVQFVREASAAERAEYQAARDAAYVQARSRFERQFARWQREETQCRGNDAAYCRYRPDRPADVTPETFAYPPLEMVNMLPIARNPQFTRAEGEYTYLMAVRPGTYILYGAIAATDDGPVGVCLCMGSVRFDVPEGRIVDVGEIRYSPDRTREVPRRNMTSQFLVPATADSPRPDRLAGLTVVPAELRAAGKMPNFSAVEIDRHPPIEGVLAYERDRVVDLRAEPAPAATAGN
jgi:hypothetical protein